MRKLILSIVLLLTCLVSLNVKGQDELNFMKGNTVFIYGVFDDSVINIIPDLIQQIQIQKQMKNGSITFYINSPGGRVDYLLNLLALVEDAKQNGVIVKTIVLADAYSAASLLAASGTQNFRFISHYSEHLIHLGSVEQGTITTDKELERLTESSKSHFNNVRALYKKYGKIKDLDKKLETNYYFLRGQEIINNGLADHFVD